MKLTPTCAYGDGLELLGVDIRVLLQAPAFVSPLLVRDINGNRSGASKQSLERSLSAEGLTARTCTHAATHPLPTKIWLRAASLQKSRPTSAPRRAADFGTIAFFSRLLKLRDNASSSACLAERGIPS